VDSWNKMNKLKLEIEIATGMKATIVELSETVFSMQSMPRLHKESILSCELGTDNQRESQSELSR
jgi:hypothetical protein